MNRISSITIRGYRSFKDATLTLRPLNVLIGANGAGKSNVISFFKMMNELIEGRLQLHTALTGGAASNLHLGPEHTPRLETEIEIEMGNRNVGTYRMQLGHAQAQDTLSFTEEHLLLSGSGSANDREEQLGADHRESLIGNTADGDGPMAATAQALRSLLEHCRTFHFHDTSPTSSVRNGSYVGNGKRLMSDAGNLAAVLHRLKSATPETYRMIVGTIRLIAPFFADFELKPETRGKNVLLNWRHRKNDDIHGPHQLSDGTLRAMCLVTLLTMPAEERPSLIVIDEPELGLHPYALAILASLCRSASTESQIVIGTQSSTLLNHFDPEDIVVVENDGKSSTLVRPNTSDLEKWLENYSLGELWMKNVIGGRPQ